MREIYTFIDLFAGLGGFRLALEKFNNKCVFSSEWDKHAQDIYERNFHERPDGDITQINEEDIPAHDIICAGFPCQAFSISGKRLGFDDARGTLFFDVLRIAKYHQPKVLFLENVRNFEKHDGGKTLLVVKKSLEDIGYSVFYKVLNASQYGAATSRQRIYIVAFRSDLQVSEFHYPVPKKTNIKIRDFLNKDIDTSEYEIRRDDIFLKNIVVEKDLFNEYPQKPIRIGTINKGGQGERIYSDLGHAITFSAYGGGAGSKTGAYYIDGVVRKLAPREVARIMGYPDSYIIHENKNQAYKQFGNSVVVPVLEQIFEEVLKVLDTNQNGKAK